MAIALDVRITLETGFEVHYTKDRQGSERIDFQNGSYTNLYGKDATELLDGLTGLLNMTGRRVVVREIVQVEPSLV